MINFLQYLQSLEPRYHPHGEFIRDAQQDKMFPSYDVDWEDVKRYLVACGACEQAIQSAAILFGDYERNY